MPTDLEAALQRIVREAIREEVPDLLRATLAQGSAEGAVPRAADPSGRWVSAGEAARIAGVTAPTIRSWIHAGRLKSTKPGGGRQHRILTTDLERLMSATGGPPPETRQLKPSASAEKILSRLREKSQEPNP